jgi:hypothetical protein
MPLNYDPADPDMMRLPTGLTCGDCVHIRRCKTIFGHTEADKTCDWSPSRFRRALPEEQQAEAIRELPESATFAMPPDGDGQTVEISMDAYRKVCAVFPDLVRREG